MSAISLNNRVTSDSDVTFTSCTVLPIQQTTLNIEDMAGIDGLGSLGETIDAAIDYVSDVIDSVGDYVSDAAETARIAVFGGGSEVRHISNSFAPPPARRDTTTATPREPHTCDGPVVYTSYGSCLCPEVLDKFRR